MLTVSLHLPLCCVPVKICLPVVPVKNRSGSPASPERMLYSGDVSFILMLLGEVDAAESFVSDSGMKGLRHKLDYQI